MKDIMELLEECRNTVKNKFSKEEIKKIEDSDNFIKAMIKADNFNIFYNMLNENYSKMLFKKIVKYRYMLSFYRDAFNNNKEKIKLSIKYGSINIFSWGFKRLLFALQKYKYPIEIENFLLFYIFGLNLILSGFARFAPQRMRRTAAGSPRRTMLSVRS